MADDKRDIVRAAMGILDDLETQAFNEAWNRSVGFVVVQIDIDNGKIEVHGPFEKNSGFVSDEYAQLLVQGLNVDIGNDSPWTAEAVFLFPPDPSILEAAQERADETSARLHLRIDEALREAREKLEGNGES